MDLSVVIPVYNEAQKIRGDITAASDFLSKYGMTGEIIVVDDGSTDQTSEVVLNSPVDEGISLRIIAYVEHTGKGKAVKTGIMEACSDIIMFIDSGNCVPYENINRGINLLKEALSSDPGHPAESWSPFFFENTSAFTAGSPETLPTLSAG
jgi:dolichyl-phosphate beta-glucosyltransferase